MEKMKVVAKPGSPQILVTRKFDAPRELVFRAFVDPDLLVQWLGPRDMTLDIERLEVRAGGTYRFTHRDANSREYTFHGVFHQTPSVDGIVQTYEYEGAPGIVALETITFRESHGKTLLHQNAVYQSVADRDASLESGEEVVTRGSMHRLVNLIESMVLVV